MNETKKKKQVNFDLHEIEERCVIPARESMAFSLSLSLGNLQATERESSTTIWSSGQRHFSSELLCVLQMEPHSRKRLYGNARVARIHYQKAATFVTHKTLYTYRGKPLR